MLYGDNYPQAVERYRKELEDEQTKLAAWTFPYQEGLIQKIQEAVAAEIKLCDFYTEFNKRRNEGQLKEYHWQFIEQKDTNEYRAGQWQNAVGDWWVRTNGRVQATILIDRTGTMVKISLNVENDSKALTFCDVRYFPSAHVKSEASIVAKIDEFKEIADRFLNEHIYPKYTRGDAIVLDELLCLRWRVV